MTELAAHSQITVSSATAVMSRTAPVPPHGSFIPAPSALAGETSQGMRPPRQDPRPSTILEDA